MALVDTLDYFPQKHPHRAELIAILNRVARRVAKYQDARSGLWYQVLDKGEKVVTNDPKGIGAFLWPRPRWKRARFAVDHLKLYNKHE